MGIRKEIVRKLRHLEVDESVEQLVNASLSGPGAVEAVLKGEPVAAEPDDMVRRQSAASVYLQSITVQGFRGIGPKATLELDAQPGLTLVVGRNGSGKSSFFDGLEVLLTGDSFRWKGKTAVWKKGWRNLHRPTGARVTAKFQTEGVRGDTTVEIIWPDDAGNVTEVGATAQHIRQKRTNLAGIGWAEPLELYRPLLSHPELGGIALRPSGLYDTFNKVLGLEETTSAGRVLSKARTERDKQVKSVRRQLKQEILPLLENTNDERSHIALEALSGRIWLLRKLEQLLTGDQRPALRSLQDLSAINLPSATQVMSAAETVEQAVTGWEEVKDSELHRSGELADLLQTALDHHRNHSTEICPVCEGSLDAEWHTATQIRISRLRSESGRYREAKDGLQKAVRQAQALVQPPTLPEDTSVDVSPLQEAWRRWSRLPQDPSRLPAHLINDYPALEVAVQLVSRQAQQLYSEQEERWAPIRTTMLKWLSAAQDAEDLPGAITSIRKAEATLTELAEGLRKERWEPIERQALQIWGELRLQSNLDLDSIALTGKGTQRRVELNAKVDGERFQALGVASQGELNCLALSLFFPRGALPESPFRFLIIDDPVQAMDPARVDGLGKVFHQVARDRQLVVFTHDDRLPEALRRLDLPHRVLEVARQKGSVVTVRKVLGPVEQYLNDAWAVAMEDNLDAGVSHQVVPGFCRQALEAACVERIRRERIRQGVSHAEVEQEVDRANTLIEKAALALLGNVSQAGQVYNTIAQRWGEPMAQVVRVCNRGSHAGFSGDLQGLINASRGLAARIRNT